MSFKSSSEKGFTLLELLVSIGILSVLASLAVLNFEHIREKVYDAEFYAFKHDAWIALQAGSAYFEEKDVTDSRVTGVLKAGPITGWKQRLLPGIIVPENFELSAQWSPRGSNCSGGLDGDGGMCFVRMIYVKHCKTLKYSMSNYYHYSENGTKDGMLHALFANGAQPCT